MSPTPPSSGPAGTPVDAADATAAAAHATAAAQAMAARMAAHPDTFGVEPSVYRKRWVILGVLCVSLIMVVTAVSSLNVAIPSIQAALDASGTQLQWIIDSYALVFAGFLLPAGALGDRFGRKGALLVGLVLFGVLSLAASEAPDANVLIAIRAGLGIGAALIMPATLSIIVNSFPMHERPKAIAVWAAFAGVGGALGPISSGLLLEHYWWGSVFFMNVLLSVILFGLVAFIVPTSKDPGETALDPVGALLSIVGLVALVFGVIEGPELGWGAPLTIAGFVVAALALFGFVRYELSIRSPMLDPRLFKLRGFSAGAGSITLVFFCMFGMFFLLTQYLQFVLGYTPLQAGIRTLPSALMIMIVAPQGPRLVARFGVKKVVRTGFLLAATAFVLYSFATPETGYGLIAVALVCNGIGIAMLMPPSSQHIVGSLPLHKSGVGSAVNDVTREVGGALGIAISGTIVATIYRSNNGFTSMIPNAEAAGIAGESIGQAIGVARRALAEGFIAPPQVDALHRAASVAFTDGTHVAFLVMAVVAVASSFLIGHFIPDELPMARKPAPAGAPNVPTGPTHAHGSPASTPPAEPGR